MAVRETSAVPTAEEVRAWLDRVPDPEIPVLSVNDLGIVRDIRVAGGRVTVSVTPTYTGCPATEVIEGLIERELRRRGVEEIEIERLLSPPWTTDWLSDAGRSKLKRYGIAPPEKGAGKRGFTGLGIEINCPRCSSTDTARISEFGSTPCKASFRCNECLEPFEYFKCI